MQIKSRLLHPAIIQKYASLFSVEGGEATNILQDAQLQLYNVRGPLNDLKGFVTPQGVALNANLVTASDCELVAVLAHELGHNLVRKNGGSFDLFFHTPARAVRVPPQDPGGDEETSDLERALVSESGCAAEIAIMGVLLDWPSETERNAEQMTFVDELVLPNLERGHLPSWTPFLRRCCPTAHNCVPASVVAHLCFVRCHEFSFRGTYFRSAH